MLMRIMSEVNKHQPGSQEYSLLSQRAWNLNQHLFDLFNLKYHGCTFGNWTTVLLDSKTFYVACIAGAK